MNKNLPAAFALLCLFSMAIYSPSARAQTNFRPGYVLPLTGDTLRGEVDSREGRANAQRCRFRPTAQAEATTYLPDQLRAYGFTAENRHYRSMTVAIDKAAPQSFFLEVLVDGPASLFFLRDAEQRENYYVVSPNYPLTLLPHGMVQALRDNQPVMQVQTAYRNILSASLAGCQVVQKQLPRLAFQESALIKVVSTYNTECAGYRPSRPQPSGATSHVSIGIMAGGVQHSMTYTGFPFKAGESFERTHTGIAVGPVLQYRTSRLGQRLSIVAAVLYEPEKYEIEGEGRSSNGFAGLRFRHRFDLAYLRLPVMVRYTYPRGKVAPMAEAGFTVAYAVKENTSAEEMDRYGTYSPSQPTNVGSTGKGFSPVQTGFAVGLGLYTHVAGGRGVSALVRAEKANGFSKAIDATSTILHLYGLISLDLTK
ncbi:outer membrane beta-barrel protein [Hymenobacter sp. BT770]|uniref:outer membrane beta-barrel protein n=1 Tax=Hymenobacter sp. BT770 TaxID=2886942 RepID=UPI001D10D056|nr:outer membrane beta-barrel protein [Hymenobacter sp. BT770]MCC3152603.1 PorT family protein [Hymenobacter sp. BT770]MDO3414676.1 outer membrane beta-barrel protein [Hymenobacter sp. BT770]